MGRPFGLGIGKRSKRKILEMKGSS